MSKRNLTVEIRELKQRGVFDTKNFYNSSFQNIEKLLEAFKHNQSKEFDEFYKYVPIACVTAIESFFRIAIKSMIDKGGVYFDNLSALIPTLSLKIDFEILLSLQKQQFTVGEFISHLLPCNNLNDFNRNLSTIMGNDFLKKIKEFKPMLVGIFEEDEFNKFNLNYNSILASVKIIFELRHIYCHEPYDASSINKNELGMHYENFKFFLDYSSNFTSSLIYDSWGISAYEHMENLDKVVAEKQGNLSKVLQEYENHNKALAEFPEHFKETFDNMILYWKEYSDAKGKLKGSYTPSGIWSTIIGYEQRLKDIQELTNFLK